MSSKTIPEIIAIHDEARKRATDGLANVLGGQSIAPQDAVTEIDRMIAQQHAQVEATKAAMEASASRFEEEIRRREQRIAELSELQERFKRGTAQTTAAATQAQSGPQL